MAEHSVLKFGGSSVSRPEQVAEIFTKDSERNRIAVVSAVGKDPFDGNGYPKVTDKLIELEKAVERGDRTTVAEAQEFVIARNRDVYSMLDEHALDKIINESYEYLQPKNWKDGFQWVGEYMSARLLAELTGAEFVDSDLRFSGGVLQDEDSLQAIRDSITPVLHSGRQIVIPGFYGREKTTGRIATLPRGGSDTTGVLYTGAFVSQEGSSWINENYTNKDGILSTDPDIVPNAQVIPEMTHDEVREKMHGITERNGVVHGNAIAYASRLGVDMWVKNTHDTASAGTRITAKRKSDPERPVIGITGKCDLVAISTYDMGMADAENYVTPILEKVGELGMAWSNIPTGEDRLKIIFNSGTNEDNLELIEQFIREKAISGNKAKVKIKRNQGAVYIVGQELAKSLPYTKTLGKVATVLADHNLAMREVVSHEESPSLALTVKGSRVEEVIRLLHAELIG